MRFIGSKRDLVDHIEQIVKKYAFGDEQVFVDLFAGTNIVAERFKKYFSIITNDILYFSYINAKAIIENNGDLEFISLKEKGISSPLDYLQSGAEEYVKGNVCGYYEQNYTPSGEAMYFSVANGKRIDFIRNEIDDWYLKGHLTELEYCYLVSSLIEAIPFISNITGTYGAYLKHWDKRAINRLELLPLAVTDNGRNNKSFNTDSNELIKQISADIVYVDTPYNTRQYASNYHVLENIAQNSKPELRGISRIFDWQDKRSSYSMKRKAMKSMSELIKNIDSTHVIVSYNNEGIIHEEDLISLMKSNAVDGNVYVEKIPYRKYKSKKPSKTNHVYELLLYIRKKKRNNVMVNLQNPPLKTQKWSAKKEQLIKSPMNYIGGKYRLLRQILPLFPQDIDVFVDLFSGGANVGINVKANKHIFNDMNDKVNEIFRYFAKNNPDDIIHKIKDRITEFNLSKYNEQSFKEFRDKYNQDPNPLDLYVLTSYSYNHQVRFNNSMEFNNPFGRNRSQFSENMEKNLMRFVRKLHTLDATFLDNYFDELDLSWLSTSDFVYLDPPYLITTGNYNDGNRGFKDWGEQQERRLYELMDLLSNNCVRYALSNVLEHKGKSNEMLKNYLMKRNVNLHDVEYNYDNASHNSKSTGSREVLITNYDAKTGILLN